MKEFLKSISVVSLFRMYNHGYLKKSGWLKSVTTAKSVDANGSPIPWFTFASLRFLESKLTNDLEVFEYGSGNSTIWLSERVGSLVSVEHDKLWFEEIKDTVGALKNSKHIFRSLSSNEYADSILEVPFSYDVVIIDGRDRIKCCENALTSLKENGVIIWDNSDRIKHQQAYDLLAKSGFRRIDFWGIGPIGINEWCTSIFYRSANCFNI